MMTLPLLVATLVFLGGSPANADWSVFENGAWPSTWPTEMEPLRKQASSIQGGMVNVATHHIPFKTRKDFEAAWPHILRVKTNGAPIVLIRTPGKHWHFGETEAGVLIHCPPGNQHPTGPAKPIEGTSRLRERWLWSTYVELVVDGKIVDLNRITLPLDTPIIDQRFARDRP